MVLVFSKLLLRLGMSGVLGVLGDFGDAVEDPEVEEADEDGPLERINSGSA